MSVQKRITKHADGTKQIAWRVRWQEPSGAWRSKTFDKKADAAVFDGDLRRHRRLGSLASLDAGTETLNAYMTDVWSPTFGVLLAAKTKQTYSTLWDLHISPFLGDVPLRELTPELAARWQSSRLAAGAGPVSVRQSLGLLGNVLQRAVEAGRVPSNPVRLVRSAPLPHRAEVRPLAPVTVEAMRAASSPRDAMLISLMAYAGLRPGEALALRWVDVRDQTLLIERSASYGSAKGTKTGYTRTVRLLSPLASDLREWRLRSGRPTDTALVVPAANGGLWAEQAYKSWARQAFRGALRAAGIERGRPYDLRHSFASLLIHEGRSVIYVARQLGHGAQLTLMTYGHVIDELEEQPHQKAEDAILAARSHSPAHFLPMTAD